MEFMDSLLLRWKMSSWNIVVLLVWLQRVLKSSVDCGGCGVVAEWVGSITLIGAKMTVHHNCTYGRSWCYGLYVWGSSSTIQLVSPLTKEQVAIDNGGGGNWGTDEAWGGDISQIKTIDAPVLSTSSSVAAPASETKANK